MIAEDGSYGWGEGYGPAGVIQAGAEFLAPLVIGEDPLQVESVWNKMHLRSLDMRGEVFWWRRSAQSTLPFGLARQAAGAAGFCAFGGRRREMVKVYATGMYFVDSDDLIGKLVEEAQGYVAEGFKALKMKVGAWV